MASTLFTDFKNAVVGGTSLRAAAARTADANGTGIDFQDADGPVFAILSGGDIDVADANETYVIEFEESDDDLTYTDIAEGVTISQTADNTDGYVVIKHRSKRYVRAVLNVSGTTPSWVGSVYLGSRKKITGTAGGSQL